MPLKVTKRGKSPYWYIRGTVKGKYVDESTGTLDRKLAEDIKIKTEARILHESVHGCRSTITFLEAAIGYMENGGEKWTLPPLINYFGEKSLNEIGQIEIDEAAKRLYPNAKNSSKTRLIYTPMSAILKWADKRDLYSYKPLARPKIPKSKIVFLNYAEADSLINACPPHLKPLVLFFLHTGARSCEAMNLDWRDVNLQMRQIRFVDTKNGESRSVPLHNEILAALANMPHREGKVFRKADGTEYKSRDSDCFKKSFQNAVKRAGIVHISPHKLRHTWATWYYQRTKDITKLMELGGWKDPEMAFRYAHLDVSSLAPSVEAMPNVTGENRGINKHAQC